MSILDRLKNARPKPVEIVVPSWGDEKVFVLPLNIDERREFTEAFGEASHLELAIATTLDRMVEENGDRVFDEENDEHMEIFRQLDSDGMLEVFEAICSKGHRQSSKVKGARKNSRKTRR